jgi:hypothetical protein
MNKKNKKIQITVDELACFTASAIAGAYSILGKELKGSQIRQIYQNLVNDISDLDFQVTKSEFIELLNVYESRDQIEKRNQN